MRSHTILVQVMPADIDDLGHANNVHYLRWMLQAAESHWAAFKAVAPAETVAGIGWVVIRHELDYFASALEGDRLEVTTWIPDCTALTCNRCYQVKRVGDGVILARGLSSYCVVDLTTGRPRRLGDALWDALGQPPRVPRSREERLFPPMPD